MRRFTCALPGSGNCWACKEIIVAGSPAGFVEFYEVEPDSDDAIQRTCEDLPPPYLPPPEPESPPPPPEDPTAVDNAQEQALFANNKREAQRYWSMCRAALDDAAYLEFPGLYLSQEHFANAQRGIANAVLLTPDEWNELVQQYPHCRNGHGCTVYPPGQIYVNGGVTQYLERTNQIILVHEGIHLLLLLAGDRSEEREHHEFMEEFLKQYPRCP